MSTLTCWLNTTSPQSQAKPCVWLKDKSGLLKNSVFVNFESNEARDILIDILRQAYAVDASFEIAIDVKDITTKNGTMSIKTTLEDIMSIMVETVKAEPKAVDAKTLSKAESMLAGLRARPVVERVAVAGTLDDGDIFDFFEA